MSPRPSHPHLSWSLQAKSKCERNLLPTEDPFLPLACPVCPFPKKCSLSPKTSHVLVDQTLCVFVFGWGEVVLGQFPGPCLGKWRRGYWENPQQHIHQLGQKSFMGLLLAPRITSKCFTCEDIAFPSAPADHTSATLDFQVYLSILFLPASWPLHVQSPLPGTPFCLSGQCLLTLQVPSEMSLPRGRHPLIRAPQAF